MEKRISAGTGVPRYLQLAERLTRDIAGGIYKVGDLLPTEVELSERHGVSRNTIREAIRKLAEIGLISRRQGIGTRVKAKSVRQLYTASLGSIEDQFQHAPKPYYKVISEEKIIANVQMAKMLKCKKGQHWLRFETCRYVAGEARPISYSEIFVLPEYEDVRLHLRKRNPLVYRFIESHFNEHITEVRQVVGAVAVSEHASALLGVKAGVPALRVFRYFIVKGDRPICVTANVYPDKRLELSTQWHLEWGKS